MRDSIGHKAVAQVVQAVGGNKHRPFWSNDFRNSMAILSHWIGPRFSISATMFVQVVDVYLVAARRVRWRHFKVVFFLK
jgi:hypothetical protein